MITIQGINWKLMHNLLLTPKRNHLRQIDIFRKIGKAMKVKSEQNLS